MTPRGHDGVVERSKLLDRLEEIERSGKFPSSRQWCVAAGLSPSYLGTLKTRLRRTPSAAAGSEELQKLARAAGISVSWLMGEDPPAPQRWVEREDIYPSRATVLALAGDRIEPEVRQAVMLERCDGGDPGPDYWRRRLVELKRDAQRLWAELEGEEFTE